MIRLTILLVIGFLVFISGWAVRSTVIMHSYENKPVGGAMITAGFVIMGVAVWSMARKNR